MYDVIWQKEVWHRREKKVYRYAKIGKVPFVPSFGLEVLFPGKNGVEDLREHVVGVQYDESDFSLAVFLEPDYDEDESRDAGSDLDLLGHGFELHETAELTDEMLDMVGEDLEE